MTNANKTSKNGKKKRSKLNIFLIILIILTVLSVVLTAVGVIYVKKNFNYKYNEITKNPEELGASDTVDDEIMNIALFGVDSRENTFKGRSDSIMILSVNLNTKKIKLISVLRDSFVPIEKNGKTNYSKINSAYASGGPELAIKTLNSVFALDITEYATVNFGGMEDIIDAVGGVEVTVTESELQYVNSNLAREAEKYGGNKEDYKITAGKNNLNGVKAVLYSRIRYFLNSEGTANDYGRTDRQRLVLQQLFNKAVQMNKTRYIELISTLAPCCETSLSYSEILNLGVKVLLNKPTFEESRVPSLEYTMAAPKTSAGSIVYYDLEFAANIIHAFIYNDIKPEDYIKLKDIQKNDWYKNGYKPPVIKDYKNKSPDSSELTSAIN